MKRNDLPSYRFGSVAKAIGVPEQTLRNWLFRGKDLDLFTERPAGGWRAFEERDIWVFALMVEFMRFGSTVNAAVDAARQALDIRRNPRTLEGVPHHLYAAPHPDGWEVSEDKEMVVRVSGCPSVLEIPMQQVLADTARRLERL